MNYLTTHEAAAALGLKVRIVQRYCREGRLGQRVGRQYLITQADLDRFRQTARKVGRPQKAAE